MPFGRPERRLAGEPAARVPGRFLERVRRLGTGLEQRVEQRADRVLGQRGPQVPFAERPDRLEQAFRLDAAGVHHDHVHAQLLDVVPERLAGADHGVPGRVERRHPGAASVAAGRAEVDEPSCGNVLVAVRKRGNVGWVHKRARGRSEIGFFSSSIFMNRYEKMGTISMTL